MTHGWVESADDDYVVLSGGLLIHWPGAGQCNFDTLKHRQLPN